MNYMTLGIIGHVDHGKTALVKAMTGVDTDRLREEKERGISIVLGYSHLALPNGRIGIIDVPGHEKFIRTMVSGATGIEAVLLVVDVNEGVKPQTIEHLEIADLLGIRHGVIAVTKCDAAQPGRREAVEEELEILAIDTFLEDAPVVFTSSVSGEGLEELTTKLDELVRHGKTGIDEGFAYLPIDRAFSMAGFGTVVTGTLRRGVLRVGDEIEIYPHGIRAGVRELQMHNEFTKEATPGFRTAVNLRGVAKSLLSRGDVVAAPGTLTPATFLNAHLRVLKGARAPLKHRQNVRLLFGTKETFARLHLLDREEVRPGEDCPMQFRVEEKVAVLNREHFIVRTYSPMVTVGGGTILESSARGYRRHDERAVEHLSILAMGRPSEIIREILLEAGLKMVDVARLRRDLRLTEEEMEAHLSEEPVVVIHGKQMIDKGRFDALCGDMAKRVEAFHAENPTLQGLAKDQISAELGVELELSLLDHAVGHLSEAGRIVLEKGLLRIPGFDAGESLSAEDRRCAEEIEEAFRRGAMQPPGLDEAVGEDRERLKMYRYLVENKTLIPMSGASRMSGSRSRAPNKAVVFHEEALEEAKRILAQEFSDSSGFSASEAKGALDSTRKFVIPLLEHLDATGFTKRQGDQRVLSR